MRTPNGSTRNGRDPYFPYSIPTGRIAAVLRNWLDKYGADPDSTNYQEYGLYKAEFLTGIAARRLYAILHEEGITVTFNTADSILCGLGLVNLWHVQPEDGGLADWYEADEEHPLPAIPEPTERQTEIALKHNERRARRLARKKEAAAA